MSEHHVRYGRFVNKWNKILSLYKGQIVSEVRVNIQEEESSQRDVKVLRLRGDYRITPLKTHRSFWYQAKEMCHTNRKAD